MKNEIKKLFEGKPAQFFDAIRAQLEERVVTVIPYVAEELAESVFMEDWKQNYKQPVAVPAKNTGNWKDKYKQPGESEENYQKRMAARAMKEEVEQLDELSKDTLNSYSQKAQMDYLGNARKVTYARNTLWDRYKSKNKRTKEYQTAKKQEKASLGKLEKRKDGLDLADKKLGTTNFMRQSKMIPDWKVNKYAVKEEKSLLETITDRGGAYAFGFSDKDRATHKPLGSFTEKDHGHSFEYSGHDDAWAKKHGLQHRIQVGNRAGTHSDYRYGNVKGTRAHVATDENDDGSPKMETWHFKKHNRYT